MNHETSDRFVEFMDFPLRNQEGVIYHVVPAEKCPIRIVVRHDGRQEAAFIRSRGAWLPPVFRETWTQRKK